MISPRSLVFMVFVGLCSSVDVGGAESIWIEAEHLDGIQGHCYPLGKPERRKTNGNWGLSGPGWAAEWNQGGESGFLSIATAADDDRAVASTTVDVPTAGAYTVWVRYGDWREAPERFQIRIEQRDTSPWTGNYGDKPLIDEDNEMKLYYGWTFVWGSQGVQLKKGEAKLSLLSNAKQTVARQVDVLVLTSDGDYRPRIKERPQNPAWDVLESYRRGSLDKLEPLARRRGSFALPSAWRLRTFGDKGFLYLWNVNPKPPYNWLSEDENRVLYPYLVNDEDTRKEFEKKYAGNKAVPIFSDPRIAPAPHGAGPAIFATDAGGKLNPIGRKFADWLDANPDRFWAMKMNYAPNQPIRGEGLQTFLKHRHRYVGGIAGESLGYFYPDAEKMKSATAAAKTRRELVRAFTPLTLAANAAKYREIFGKDLDRNPYLDVISCLSVGNITFAPLLYDWGARTVGYESTASTSSILGMRWAFMRGAARQNEGVTATYRSCNFGDAATIFSVGQSYTSPRNILDNYYSVYSGAGMTWYKMDIWYQYMAGSSMFYHEQGHDEFWKPGGLTAAGVKEVQLSPKGKLVDRFLRTTAVEPDRGVPFTPVAFLVDYAHGWEPAPFWPNSFKNWHGHEDRFRHGEHEKMLEEYFWTAFYPIGPKSQRPITGTNEVYVPGVFGDVFDVAFAYPDVHKWRTIDAYPVVIAAGDIELTRAEGQRLAQYMERGGTLLVADAHLTGPGAEALRLPATGEIAEADYYTWLGDAAHKPSPRFRYRPITGASVRALATTGGKVFCGAVDRGQGRLIYLAVPRGLAIGGQAVPVVPRLFAHLTRGLMPIEVVGDVEWLVNRTKRGWSVTLLNPAGQDKPQQGITATDYGHNRRVTITAHTGISKARDLLLPDDVLEPGGNQLHCEVAAGSVRILNLELADEAE